MGKIQEVSEVTPSQTPPSQRRPWALRLSAPGGEGGGPVAQQAALRGSPASLLCLLRPVLTAPAISRALSLHSFLTSREVAHRSCESP